MSVICELAAPFIANSVVADREIIRSLRGHASMCLKCQARHAAMSKTARALANMADETYSAPPSLEWRVMSSLEVDLAVERTFARPAALAAAFLSMVAAVIIWRLRPGPVS